MSCDECMEQIFELIEREAVEPESVRAILERCPECRARFEQTKAALERAGELVMEEPPASADAAILRAARERSRRAPPRRRRWLSSTRWAAAAAALLAVGVGVWAIPRAEQVERAGETKDAESEAVAAIERSTDSAPVAEATRTEESRPTGHPGTPRAQKKEALPQSKRASRDAPKPMKTLSDEDGEPAAAADSRRAEAQLAAAPASFEDASGVSAECKRRLAEAERRDAKDDASDMEPEALLATGRCYHELGDVAQARRWLLRAASHPQTKDRAERALARLPPE